MHRVMKRTWFIRALVILLLAGTALFVAEYAGKARTWVSFPGSPHVYNNSNIGTGVVTDRSGGTLLEMGTQRAYSTDKNTRISTLHWLGDRKGFIKAGAVTSYAGEMTGFDPINGVYDASGLGGVATLTLSARVQNAALEALAGRKGTVGVYNYRTGQILCAVSAPSYDPDNVPDIAGDDSGTWDGVYVNRFLQSSYVPGSIFKLVTTAAALETVPDIQDRTFRCYGKLEYGTEAVTCEGAHGQQNLRQALANSCNCAFAQIAEVVGRKTMVEYVEKFGVTQKLSFDGVTTARGNYDIRETAAVSFAWSCIGQYTDQINPARYMTFVGTVASGGEGVEPYLVAKVTSGEKTTYEAQPKSTGRIMSQETAEILGNMMRNNVITVYGDGNFGGLHVCAKSGTSELGGDLRPNAMFAGFAQDEDYPLAFIAVVENGGYGAHTCVPIMNRVLRECKAVMDEERT